MIPPCVHADPAGLGHIAEYAEPSRFARGEHRGPGEPVGGDVVAHRDIDDLGGLRCDVGEQAAVGEPDAASFVPG